MSVIAVLGANGRLGASVVQAFFEAGYKVIAVTKTGVAPASSKIEYRAADAMDRDAVIKSCAGADFILNALNLPYEKWHAQAFTIAQNVIAAAKAHNAVHLFPGNVYNYGKGIPALCDENTKPTKPTPLGNIRLKMEAFFEASAKRGDVKTIIIRAGDFYGAAKPGSWFDMGLCRKIDRGIFTYPGPMDVMHAWAYLPDLAETFVGIAGQSQDLNMFEVFTFSGHSFTGNQMCTYLENAAGKPLRATSLPWRMIKIGKLFVPSWRGISEMSYLWNRSHSLSDVKLKKVLGTIKQTPPEEAVKAAYKVLYAS